MNKKHQALHVIISVVVAFAIWLYVDSAVGTEVKVWANDIPVEYIGEETALASRGLMVIQNSEETTISLRLLGRRKVISRLDTDKIRLQVDLGDVTAIGTQNLSYKIIYPNNISASSIHVEYASAVTVSVNIGELYKKDVDIRCELTGSVPKGYIAGELQILPARLELRGQQADLMQISYAKVKLDVTDATASLIELLPYELYDYHDKPVESPNIHTVSDTVQVTLPIHVIKELPLELNLEESPGFARENVNLSVSPATITVSGDPATLEAVDSIVLDTINLSELISPSTLTYDIALPADCENLSDVTQAKVTIAFLDMTSAIIEVSDIALVNPPDGKNASCVTTLLPITIRGTVADVAAVLPENIHIVCDLTGISTEDGSYTLPATVTIDTDGDVAVSGKTEVEILLEIREIP